MAQSRMASLSMTSFSARMLPRTASKSTDAQTCWWEKLKSHRCKKPERLRWPQTSGRVPADRSISGAWHGVPPVRRSQQAPPSSMASRCFLQVRWGLHRTLVSMAEGHPFCAG
jgi:hypothetical protein